MADFTEEAVYEAFGLGEEAREVADPAEEGTQPTGEQVQEIADPANADNPSEGNPQSASNTTPEGSPAQDTGTDGKDLTPEQRRQNAEQRRQREKQAQQAATQQAIQEAIQQERQRSEAEVAAIFAGMNLRNSVTGEPITTMEQFNAWQKQQREAQLKKDMQAGKLTPEGLKAAISDHPVVQQAQQMLNRNAEQEQAQAKEQARAQARAQIDADIAEIGKLDASIGSLEDLMQAPYWKDLYAMTQKGYSLKDAHFLLNHKRLEEAKLTAAREAGAANARGKSHMTGITPNRGGGSISVPSDELAMFRQFMPNATDAEIQAYYNKYKKT